MNASSTHQRRTEDRLANSARFVRLFSMGATLLYILIGVATGNSGATPRSVAWAVLVGTAFHVYADVGNDVMDLPIDRTDPRRSTSPLVQDIVSPQSALVLALGMLPFILATLLLDLTADALAPLVVATVLIGAYNVVGKSIPIPFVGDVIQGVGWAGLVFAGAAVAGGSTVLTVWAAAGVVLYITMVNGLHGAIRDALNDSRSHARTTALLLGVTVDEAGVVTLPRIVTLWGVTLQAMFGVVLVGFGLGGGAGRDIWWLMGGATALILYVSSCVMLLRAFRSRNDLRLAMAFGTWHLFLIPASLLASSLWLMPLWMMAVSVLAFLLPPLMYGRLLRNDEFAVPSSTRTPGATAPAIGLRTRLSAMWAMTRPGTWIAAGVLVAAGSILGGSSVMRVIPLMFATAFAVAAANVFNDRCDEETDAMNRPERHLVSGAVTGNTSDKFVLAAALGSVGTSAVVGPGAAFVTSTLLLIGLAYSLVLRKVVFLGQLAVAALFAAPLLYGTLLADGVVSLQQMVAAGLVMVFVFGREILKGIPDTPGDASAGHRTPAVVFGEDRALSMFRWTMVLFCAASLGAYFVADNVYYLAASIAFAVGPAVRAVLMVRSAPTTERVDNTVAFSGIVFASGMVPLLLLA